LFFVSFHFILSFSCSFVFQIRVVFLVGCADERFFQSSFNFLGFTCTTCSHWSTFWLWKFVLFVGSLRFGNHRKRQSVHMRMMFTPKYYFFHNLIPISKKFGYMYDKICTKYYIFKNLKLIPIWVYV
jgi:hypothetical protein